MSWEEIITKFDNFAKNFAKNSNDPSLPDFFQNFADIVANSGFDKDQLKKIRDRMQKLRDLFSERKDEIRRLSSEALTKHKQVSSYVKNANYKK